LRVSLEEVKSNFRALLLLHDSVHFHQGFFVDSLPKFPKRRSVAVLRMDGDMYESTMDILFNLYEIVSIGGFIIIDDWTIPFCQQAIKDFRSWHGILDEIQPIDQSSVYWRKTHQVTVLIDRYQKCCSKGTT